MKQEKLSHVTYKKKSPLNDQLLSDCFDNIVDLF